MNSRLGVCKSAWFSNRLGRITHTGYKKLEGPLQKVALVPKVCISEIIIIPAEAEDAAAWRIVSQECCGKRSIPGEVRSNTKLATARPSIKIRQ